MVPDGTQLEQMLERGGGAAVTAASLEELQHFVRLCLDLALAAPQHAETFALGFRQLEELVVPLRLPDDVKPMTFRRQLLRQAQARLGARVATLQQPAAPVAHGGAGSLTSIARLVGALLTQKMIAFQAVADCLARLIWSDASREAPAEEAVEAAGLLAVALAPAFRSTEYGSDGQLLAAMLQARLEELRDGNYGASTKALLSSVLELAESDWQASAPVRVLQVFHDGSGLACVSLAGDVLARFEEPPADAGALRLRLSERLALPEHRLQLVSQRGGLLRSADRLC